MPIYSTLMCSEWETFVHPVVGLRVGIFATILYFFQTNDAPEVIRRQFWNWVLAKPIFNENNLAGDEHPYVYLFEEIAYLDPMGLAMCGAFHKVGVGLRSTGSKWDAFNIWGCRGFFIEGGGTRRMVDTTLQLTSEDRDLIGWDVLVAPETTADDESVESEWGCDEEALVTLDGSE